VVSYLIWGIILDWIGPRITSCASIILAVLGNLLFAISNDSTRNLFHLGFSCIGAGGVGLHLASFHLANSAPAHHAGLASSIFPIVFNISAIAFPFANLLSMAGLPLSNIFIGSTILLVFAGFGLWWIQEWRPIVRAPPPAPIAPLPHLNGHAAIDRDAHQAEQTALEKDGITEGEQVDPYAWLKFMPNKHGLPWTQQMGSWYFFWTLLWIASVLSRNAFWQGTVNRQLRSYGATSDTNAIIISWFPALIISLLPVLGPSIDKYGLPFVLSIASFFQVLYTALALVKNVPIQFVTGIVAVISRAAVMAAYFTCVSMVCGIKTFGKISGTAMAAGGVVNFSSIPINSLLNNTFKGDFFWVQVFELLWGIPLCLYPYYLWKSGKDQSVREAIERLEHAEPALDSIHASPSSTANGTTRADLEMTELNSSTDEENGNIKIDF
jgi:hypothetical protein